MSQPRRMSVRRASVLGLFGLGRLCPKEGEAQAQVRMLCIISASNTCYGKSVLLSGHAVVRNGWRSTLCFQVSETNLPARANATWSML